MMRIHKRLPLVVLMILTTVLLQVQPTLANPDTIIDSFTTSQTVTQTGTGISTDSVSATEAIGGERDVIVTVTAVGAGTSLTANIASGQLAHSQDSGVRGTTELQWDGSGDTTKSDIALGLGSRNLTADSAFVVTLNEADLGIDMKITIYTNSTDTCSSLTRSLPAHLASELPRVVIFPFNQFTQDAGCSSAASFSDVDAITLLIDGSANPSRDVTIGTVKTANVDYGDLPSVFNNTTLSDDGAAHVVGDLKLGSNIDGENDGQESSNANGDDSAGTPDDEDGVVRTPGVNWTQTGGGSVDVTVNGDDGCLSAWIDWNQDNDFDDAGENILNNVERTAGTTVSHTFSIPVDPADKSFFARFRLFPRDSDNTCTTTKYPTRQHTSGEVEDYLWSFGPNAVTLNELEARPVGHNWPLIPAAIGLATIGGVGLFALVQRRKGSASR